jgi:hypothetical protein
VPNTNKRYWSSKIERNRRRDTRARRYLNRAGFSVIRIWECTLREHPLCCVARIEARIRKQSMLAPERRDRRQSSSDNHRSQTVTTSAYYRRPQRQASAESYEAPLTAHDTSRA